MKSSAFYIALSAIIAACMASCSDDNTSTLPALSMPGDMHLVSRCAVHDEYLALNEEACKTAGGNMQHTLYVANMGSATLSYVPFYNRSAEFDVIDTTKAVPGVTSIPAGERPHAIAGDELGVFVVLVSAVNNDISIISTNDNSEIAWQTLDKSPKKIIYNRNGNAFFVFFTDGTIRKLTIDFDCGVQGKTFPTSCTLSKDKISITWNEISTVSSNIADVILHPTLNIGYVSYADKRYISVLAFDDSQGSCADGSNNYPCEIRKLGAGFGCSDGIDNDGDGLVDAQDPKCFYPWSAESYESSPDNIQVGWLGPNECNDGIDNDGDGLFDALDPGCLSSNDASEEDGFQAMTLGTCADGSDNNNDGNADRDDPLCLWPSDDEDETSGSYAPGTGLCQDGIDNDGNGFTDTEDAACYGKNGFGESDVTSTGRGPLAVDPNGRWLYVLDPTDSQLIVIDLATEKTIDRSAWYPRHRTVGIPVNRLALDVVGDIRTERIYNKNKHEIFSERAVAYVASSSGAVTEYTIHQKLTHIYNGVTQNSIDELAMRATDDNDDASYIGVVRCVGRICSESDLPEITLRRRPAVAFFTPANILSDINPETGKRHSVIYDNIIASETWRIAFEGTLEQEKRSDGYFDANGQFHAIMDMCLLGVHPGDHLVLRNRKGLKSSPECTQFDGKNLEWQISDAGPHRLSVAPTQNPNDAPAPIPDCFSSGLDYEIRANNQWIITSKSTYANRMFTAGDHCIEDPRKPYGQTRFSLSNTSKAAPDAQTAIFGVKMPPNAANLQRDDAFEFTTRTGMTNLSVGVAAAPTKLLRFVANDAHFLLISEASANTVVIYDVDDESIDDTL